MKLLLISVKSESARGGMAVWTDRYMSRCGALGIDCSLVNTDLIGSRIKTGRRNPVEEVIRTQRIYRSLRKLLKTQHFDIAHLNTSCGHFGLFRDYRIARMIQKKKIPLVTQYHCEIPFWVRSAASKQCLKKLVSCSRKNLVLCENSKQYLKDQFGSDSEKLPNFVERAMVLSQNKEIRATVEKIAFVGRVSETKGAAELFAVAKQMPQTEFLLIGEVSEQVRTWEKPANIQLLGAMPNEQVIVCLDKADLFLFPSHTEGCSMALMEAMARGLPCIATDVGANADMLADGCGIIVEKHDVDAMVSAIRSLDDPKCREEMSHRAVKVVKEGYTEKNVDKILTEVKQIYLSHK